MKCEVQKILGKEASVKLKTQNIPTAKISGFTVSVYRAL